MIKWLDVASISGKHGTKGRLVVNHAANLPFICTEGMEFYLVPPKIDVPRTLHLTYLQEVNVGCSQIEFEEIDTIDLAEAIIGCHLLIESDGAERTLSCDDASVVGLTVIDETLGRIGVVSSLIDMGYQQLLSIEQERGEESELLLPFVDEFIISIDSDAIHVDCPKGLFEI